MAAAEARAANDARLLELTAAARGGAQTRGSEPMGLSDLVSLGTLNHWARADAANGTGAGMFAAYSTVQLGLEAYRRLGGSEGEDKTAQAKREFHEAVAEYVKGDKAFKKAAKPKQKVHYPPPSSSWCPSPAGFRTRA